MIGAVVLAGEARGDSQARQLAHQAYETIKRHRNEPQLLEGAARQLDQAHALDPNEPYVWLGACVLSVASGYKSSELWDARSYDPASLSTATALAQRVVTADSALVDGHIELAWLFVIQRRFAEAQHEYVVAHQIDPENFRVWSGQAVCSWGQGDARKSEAALAGAAARVHTVYDQVTLNQQRVRVARSRGDLAEVERILKEDIALQPASPWAHGNYAGFLKGQNRLDEAIREYEKAIAIAPYPIAQRGLEETRRFRDAARRRN
jgi:tetratricopeptide (TPR) repeat protein